MEDKLIIYATEKEINNWFDESVGLVKFYERVEQGEEKNKYSVLYRHSGGATGEESIPHNLHSISAVEKYAEKLQNEYNNAFVMYSEAERKINEICRNDYWVDEMGFPPTYPQKAQDIAVEYLYQTDLKAHKLSSEIEHNRENISQSVVDEYAATELKYDCALSVVRTVNNNYRQVPGYKEAPVYKIVSDKDNFAKLVDTVFVECDKNRGNLQSPASIDNISLDKVREMIKKRDKENEIWLLNNAREARYNNAHYEGAILRIAHDDTKNADYVIQLWETDNKEHGLVKHCLDNINSAEQEKLDEGTEVSISYKGGKGGSVTLLELENKQEKEIER